MAESLEASPAIPAPPCRRLRFKGMYVYTDGFHAADDHEYDNTIFWCQKTLKDVGPDQGFVGREDCREGSRACYEAD